MVKEDDNGFLEYSDTKFFCECVADYLGREIDPDGRMGCLPNKIYSVYRPLKEITKPEFLKSLENKPLVNDHTVIGNKPGMMNPDKKNVGGVISGIKVVGNELHCKVNIFSPEIISKIHSGKRELSLAYRCEYKPCHGVFDGKRYDFVQTNLRSGNHLALVDEARNGHDCRVMDCAFTCDQKIQLEKPDMDISKLSADELVEALKGCSDECKAKAKEFFNTPTADEKKAAEEAAAKAAADAEAAKKAEAEKCEADKKAAVDAAVAEATKKAEDAAKVAADEAAKNLATACDAAIENYKKAIALAEDCKPSFGTIAMDGIKTEQDVALKICALDAAPKYLKECKPEDAVVALRGYVAGSAHGKATITTDSKAKAASKSLADYMKTR